MIFGKTCLIYSNNILIYSGKLTLELVLPQSLLVELNFVYLVSLKVAHPLSDGGLHVDALLPQFAVLLVEVLLLLQQGHVASCQFFLINLKHRQFAQCFTQLSLDFVWVLLKGVKQLLKDECD